MGGKLIKFFKWLFASNAKLAANKILGSCEIHSGDYNAAFRLTVRIILEKAKKSPNYDSVLLLHRNEICNFTQLAALDLNLFAEAVGASFSETLLSNKNEIEECFRKGGIPEKYISGDVRELLTRNV
jgi:hypothetical protein